MIYRAVDNTASTFPVLCGLGLLTQGGGQFDTFVSSFYLQFSPNGSQWFTYKELITDARPKAKVSVFFGIVVGSLKQNRPFYILTHHFIRSTSIPDLSFTTQSVNQYSIRNHKDADKEL